MEDLLYILKRLSVVNQDDGLTFTDTERLDSISFLLSGSPYRKAEADGLFHMYSRRPVHEISGPVILVSSHVDCHRRITRCFTEIRDDGYLLGTFDNSITNAAIVYLMLSSELPDNVLVVFTGDEEEDSRGAADVSHFLRSCSLDIKNVFVLDVTSEGWDEHADLTVENDFWDEDFGERVIELLGETDSRWRFVPEDPDEIPDFIPKECIIHTEADPDESWEYDEEDCPCFSFCLPSAGEMHSDEGIAVRISSFRKYTEAFGRILMQLG